MRDNRTSKDTALGAPSAETGSAAPGGSGAGRVLVAVYGTFALAAGARAAVQLSTRFAEAPVAYLLSAFAAVVYIVATAGLVEFSDIDDLVLVWGSVGVGGGLVVDGEPLTGSAGYSGEIGHIPVNPEGHACRCGSLGCWETEVGSSAILRRAGYPPEGGHEAVDAVLAQAAAGDPIDTQDFVRPRLQDGRLVLTVQPGMDGYVPFEQPNPTPCCADHNGLHGRLDTPDAPRA